MRSGPDRTRRHIARAIAATAVIACSSTEPSHASDPATDTFYPFLNVNLSQMTKLASVLYVQDVVVGTGADFVTGAAVVVADTGWMADGVRFEGRPSNSFTIGAHAAVEGLDMGVIGMKVGGKRKIVMGSDLGYGSAGAGCTAGQQNCKVRPNSTLVYTVYALTVK